MFTQTEQTISQEIDALLEVVVDASALASYGTLYPAKLASLMAHLEECHEIPPRAVEMMIAVINESDDSEPTLRRKMVACDVLGQMGLQANRALASVEGLLPLVQSPCDFERWLSLFAARAVWKITGDSNAVVDVASKIRDGKNEWLRHHALAYLSEVYCGE
jgi:hypothetical protein